MSVALFFALLGGVILLGFLGDLLFRLTRIPSVLLLMGIGVLLGPAAGLVRSEVLAQVAPYFGTLALLLILFEGGLDLKVETVIAQFGKAVFLAATVFVLSVLLVTFLATVVAGMTLLTGALLGAVLGGTSGAIVIPVVSGLRASEETKTVLGLESALTDVAVVVSVSLLLEAYRTATADPEAVLWSLASTLGVALGLGLLAGLLWARFVGWMSGEALSSMLTLAMIFLLYAAVEKLRGSGALAILFFAIALANASPVLERFGHRLRPVLGTQVEAARYALDLFMRRITVELSFLVRTFFFVFIGLLLDVSLLTWRTGVLALGIVATLLWARRLGVFLFVRLNRGLALSERRLLLVMAPRGLAAAVMASYPAAAGVAGTEAFPLFAFLTIAATTLTMTIGVVWAERAVGQAAPSAVAEPIPADQGAGGTP